jgi:hypothetical protein
MAEHIPQYRIYLLTVWREHSHTATEVGWRFRLEEARTQQSRCFTDVTTLAATLLRGLDGADQAIGMCLPPGCTDTKEELPIE